MINRWENLLLVLWLCHQWDSKVWCLWTVKSPNTNEWTPVPVWDIMLTATCVTDEVVSLSFYPFISFRQSATTLYWFRLSNKSDFTIQWLFFFFWQDFLLVVPVKQLQNVNLRTEISSRTFICLIHFVVKKNSYTACELTVSTLHKMTVIPK